MINTIIFDIGQVLMGWHPEWIDKVFPKGTAEVVFDAIWKHGFWEDMDMGVLSDEENLEKMIQIAPAYEEQIRYMFAHLSLVCEKQDYAIPWIQELKKEGYNVYYLSNYSRHLRSNAPEVTSFLPYTDGGIFSSDVQLVKPDSSIYELLCERYGLIPEDCLFVDDRKENVDAAISVGMKSIQFRNYDSSYREIMEYLKIQKFCSLVDELEENQTLQDAELLYILNQLEKQEKEDTKKTMEQYLYRKADKVRRKTYGTDVYLRGLIEFTNYCKNDCYYCGIRRGNRSAERYRLTKEEIMSCCQLGYQLGYRTFVLQGGEDPYYTDERMCDMIAAIRKAYPDCAITLSIGEKSRESYQAYFDAGADRYLLRHETADESHYGMLHPKELSTEHRQQCLRELKEIGYQIGCGIMVGAPYQTQEHILKDLRFMQELGPHMIGIGPFIPHKDTPFHNREAGTLEHTLHLLGIIRLMFPHVLLPATTALGTIHPLGREMGIQAGANVVMPNLSPRDVRGKYLLYDGKICTGDEAAECRHCMEKRMSRIGYQIVSVRGDYIS